MVVTTTSESTDAIAAPSCFNTGIRAKFAHTFTTAPVTVARKIIFSIPVAVKIICPRKYAIEKIRIRILKILNVEIAGSNAFPNKRGTTYPDVAINPATQGSAKSSRICVPLLISAFPVS